MPCHNPDDLIDHLLQRLSGGRPSMPLLPWFAGFTGSVDVATPQKRKSTGAAAAADDDDRRPVAIERFQTRGRAQQVSSTEVLISELPVGVWTQGYKEWLLRFASSGAIASFTEVRFRFRFRAPCWQGGC